MHGPRVTIRHWNTLDLWPPYFAVTPALTWVYILHAIWYHEWLAFGVR